MHSTFSFTNFDILFRTGRPAYIVPCIVGPSDWKIATALEVPVLAPLPSLLPQPLQPSQSRKTLKKSLPLSRPSSFASLKLSRPTSSASQPHYHPLLLTNKLKKEEISEILLSAGIAQQLPRAYGEFTEQAFLSRMSSLVVEHMDVEQWAVRVGHRAHGFGGHGGIGRFSGAGLAYIGIPLSLQTPSFH